MAASTNHLANEKSPYLQQHALNPIDWYPWSDEAFAKAASENKPVFLSIGYSTCHWCHVMAHESFEDSKVAEYFNNHFVSIKIDREERPDLDKIYMDVVVATVGNGGWPLTLFLTPDGKPIYGGTYFPKESRWGVPGLLDIAGSIIDAWENKKEQILQSAEGIIKNVINRTQPSQKTALTPAIMESAYKSYARDFDSVFGGFNRAPKFPSPHNLEFLLGYAQAHPESQALGMVTTTLTKMFQGGLFDQIGGGFHRYSVDARWRVPHFEKMLYDQAGLAAIYTEAWLATQAPIFADAVHQTLAYVQRDLLAPEGVFYSAEDADSYTDETRTHKKEGAYYLWSWAELQHTLSPEEFALVEQTYGIQKTGNIQEDPHNEFTELNILHTEKGMESKLLNKAKAKLLNARNTRVRPHLDDKTLVSWNGMMISAYARAANAFERTDYAGIAKTAADFILNNIMDTDCNLKHRYIQGEAAIDGMLEDYAFFIAALIDIYQIDYELHYLCAAKGLTDRMVELFWDQAHHGFFATSKPPAHFANRQKELHDGASPAPNSVAAMNLMRLARILRDSKYEELAGKLTEAASMQLHQVPLAFPSLLLVLDFTFGPAHEFVLAAGASAEATQKIDRLIKSRYIPNSVMVRRPYNMTEDSPEYQLLPWLLEMGPKGVLPQLYACENFTCREPLHEYEAIEKLVTNYFSAAKEPTQLK